MATNRAERKATHTRICICSQRPRNHFHKEDRDGFVIAVHDLCSVGLVVANNAFSVVSHSNRSHNFRSPTRMLHQYIYTVHLFERLTILFTHIYTVHLFERLHI